MLFSYRVTAGKSAVTEARDCLAEPLLREREHRVVAQERRARRRERKQRGSSGQAHPHALDGICINRYNSSMDVITTDEFSDWYGTLEVSDVMAVNRVVDLLAARGVKLGFPFSSAINGAPFALRELRVQSGGRPIRVFYAFDPRRDSVLILGGDKTGNDRFYEEMVPRCETIWKEYLAEQERGRHDEKEAGEAPAPGQRR
jgi:hypothetical protein